MHDEFLIIGFTYPKRVDDEAERITSILESVSAHLMHIRKPEEDVNYVRSLIKAVPERFHYRLKLHDHFELLEEFELGGVHLNHRNSVAPANSKSISRSFHSLEELTQASDYDYVTLSPIFDSISKKDYTAKFNLSELKERIAGKNIIALGGVTPDKFPVLKESGFIGAAMLGYFWE